MSEGHVSHSEFVEHSEHGHVTVDHVTTLKADHDPSFASLMNVQ